MTAKELQDMDQDFLKLVEKNKDSWKNKKDFSSWDEIKNVLAKDFNDTIKNINDEAQQEVDEYNDQKQAEVDEFNSTKNEDEKAKKVGRPKEAKKISLLNINQLRRLIERHFYTVRLGEENKAPLAIYNPLEGIYETDGWLLQRIVEAASESYNGKILPELTRKLSLHTSLKQVSRDSIYTPVGNGLFNLKTMELEPFNHEQIFTSKIQTNYVDDPKEPVINYTVAGVDKVWCPSAWFKELACNDPEIERLLWQVTNEVVTPGFRRGKFINLVGLLAGANGKGAFQELLKALVGQKNAAPTKLHSLAGEFGLDGLEGKSLAIADDEPTNTPVTDSAVINSIATGDEVKINPKNEHPHGVYLQLTIIVSSNGLVTFSNRGGTKRRILLVPFNAAFDNKFKWEKIRSEYIHRQDVLEFVLWKALHADFTEFDKYDIPQATLELTKEFIVDNSTIESFKTNVWQNKDYPLVRIDPDDVYTLYAGYCHYINKKPFNADKFKREFKEAIGTTKLKPVKIKAEDVNGIRETLQRLPFDVNGIDVDRSKSGTKRVYDPLTRYDPETWEEDKCNILK